MYCIDGGVGALARQIYAKLDFRPPRKTRIKYAITRFLRRIVFYCR
jgi:hypothetical protein